MTVFLSVVALAVAVIAYGSSTLLLSRAANGSVSSALRRPLWWTGTTVQALAFLAAFVARHSLPLLVVQPAVTASIAVTALLGTVLHRWRLSPADWAAMALVIVSLAVIGASGVAGRASSLGLAATISCWIAVLVAGAGATHRVAARPMTQGGLAGLAFGASAVAARALAADPAAVLRTTSGLLSLVLLLLGTVVGQLCLTNALSSGQVTGPVSAMYAVATVGSVIAGLLWLSDGLRPGWAPAAVVGLVLLIVGGARLEGSIQS